MPRQHSDSQEFSRFVEADSVGTHRMERRISANPEERAALARRFDLIGIDRLEAVFTLKRAGGGVIHVQGEIAAEVTQACVVTLAPVPAKISEAFSADFADVDDRRPPAESDLDFEAADPPEPIQNGHIDLGELAAEHLSLALDPYPRAPGAAIPAEFSPDPDAEAAAERPVNPFSILKKSN
ncbi:YceD family protein [Dongia sp. agr-C8]